jgi:hypothetical protein
MLGVADRTTAMLEGDVYATALVAIYDGFAACSFKTSRSTTSSARS